MYYTKCIIFFNRVLAACCCFPVLFPFFYRAAACCHLLVAVFQEAGIFYTGGSLYHKESCCSQRIKNLSYTA